MRAENDARLKGGLIIITENINCGSLTDEYQEATIELIERLNWEYEVYSDRIEVTIPEKDAAILDLIIGGVE